MTSQLDMFGGAQAPKPQKPKTTVAPGGVVASSHDELAAVLEASGNYRVLRKLRPPLPVAETTAGFMRVGVIVDTETTGLKKAEDEVIEIGAVAFRFTDEGDIGDVVGTFGALQQPSRPIPPDITKLTRITDEMVEGQLIPIAELEAFIAGADLIVAHNAGFDRPFCERLTPAFSDRAWCCSYSEIDWRQRGFEGTKLGYLLNQSGLFHDGHRAVDDCYALLEVLRRGQSDRAHPFAELLTASRRDRVRLWAENSPFDRKDDLKARGYRWSGGEGQQPKAWWTEIDAERLESEMDYLRHEIYGRVDISLTTKRLTALDRFKA
ncbi:3'-5' exonuclease [Asticcacaulis benevestitus]|uniref:Exonuclease domain-containing protein n=1 Tax=Asticcacaulis benevestitus DSM 16100 = ATCC BAA-896 TaxID=1121022 RepID=V4P9J1_9CAUL|nr:3'-5' exonuclease [Asticcacaulis benevestitus]ESQ83754.1 hypothetical protein ABENE_19985 [Asticcacaulis benevestitus DSM 16100 = ATCC BAA-896]